MPKSLSIYIAGLVTVGALALAITSFVIPVDSHIRLNVFESERLDIVGGIAFWTGLTLLASALPVLMPRGFRIDTSIAPIVAAMSLGGPTAAGLGRAHWQRANTGNSRVESRGTGRWLTMLDS